MQIAKYKIREMGGYTLVELMVVMLIFTILGVVVVQSLSHTLRSTRKSENISKVKENVEYALNTMERLLRNSQGIVAGNCNATEIWYIDEYNSNPSARFRCMGGVNGFIASGSANLRLTSTDIYIDCTSAPVFTCTAGSANVPPSIEININARDASSYGAESSNVTSTTKILLRNY